FLNLRGANHLRVQYERGLRADVRGGEVGPDPRRLIVELHGDDVLATLLVEPGVGVLDLLALDDRLVQQIDLLAVLRTGDQRQIRVVVACQHVLVLAPSGLELQRKDLDLLIVALPQLLLVSDALRQRLLTWWTAGRWRCARSWRWWWRRRRRRFLRVGPRLRRRGLRRGSCWRWRLFGGQRRRHGRPGLGGRD